MHLISIDDARKITGRSKSSIYRWVEAGLIKALRIQGVMYVDGREVLNVEPNVHRGRPTTRQKNLDINREM